MKNKVFPLCPIEPALRISALCSVHKSDRPAGYFYNGESHDFWECVFVLKGNAGVTAGDSAYSLGAGQAILHPPGEFHRIWNMGENALQILIFSFSADRFPISEHTVCPCTFADRALEVAERIRALFVTDGILIRRPRENAKPAELQRSISALEDLLLDLLSNDAPRALRTDAYRAASSALYTRAISVMKENMGRRLQMSELAALCNTSISTLQKLFFRYTGMGAMRYYGNLKMQYAENLLRDGMRVKEVALALGYTDQNYFSTAYKRHFGISPRATAGAGNKVLSHGTKP